jgi:hypothetical protein
MQHKYPLQLLQAATNPLPSNEYHLLHRVHASEPAIFNQWLGCEANSTGPRQRQQLRILTSDVIRYLVKSQEQCFHA